jgi:regulator of protease activity HflC (stomatin/prohibitin superfamily)
VVIAQQALDPGLRWVIPFAESVIVYPISKQTYTMSIAPVEGQIEGDDSIAARTADGQEIYVDASIIYSIDPNQVVKVHIDWQNRYGNDLVRAQARARHSRCCLAISGGRGCQHETV